MAARATLKRFLVRTSVATAVFASGTLYAYRPRPSWETEYFKSLVRRQSAGVGFVPLHASHRFHRASVPLCMRAWLGWGCFVTVQTCVNVNACARKLVSEVASPKCRRLSGFCGTWDRLAQLRRRVRCGSCGALRTKSASADACMQWRH